MFSEYDEKLARYRQHYLTSAESTKKSDVYEKSSAWILTIFSIKQGTVAPLHRVPYVQN